ncbi:MAG: cytochrome ubiquinol oxidase subunit I [Acidimicrobiales bacterium]
MTFAATPLFYLREQMAISLGFHIVFSCLGIGLPFLLLIAEWRYIRTGDSVYAVLARRWAKAVGVLFAVGAVSGTILSFEFGILWPQWMADWGEVFGVAFAIEGIGFFTEAVFIAIYLFSFDRFPPKRHFLVGIPIAIAGIAAALFVMSVNSWMNDPTGFTLDADGKPTDINPWKAIFGNSTTLLEFQHMLWAAFILTGFLVAMIYGVKLLRGDRRRYYRIAFLISFTFGCAFVPIQLISGDSMARHVANTQPTKLAAAEGLNQTESNAPESLGGIYYDGQLHGAIEIPNLLSLLVGRSPSTVVQGLDAVPPDDRPPVNAVHLSFDAMVGIATGLAALALWFAIVWIRRRRLPRTRWFFRLAVLAGPGAVLALWAGWIVTEVGRQPWIVYDIMRVEDAASTANGLQWGLFLVILVYTGLIAALIGVLRTLVRAELPHEVDVDLDPVLGGVGRDRRHGSGEATDSPEVPEVPEQVGT